MIHAIVAVVAAFMEVAVLRALFLRCRSAFYVARARFVCACDPLLDRFTFCVYALRVRCDVALLRFAVAVCSGVALRVAVIWVV